MYGRKNNTLVKSKSIEIKGLKPRINCTSNSSPHVLWLTNNSIYTCDISLLNTTGIYHKFVGSMPLVFNKNQSQSLSSMVITQLWPQPHFDPLNS